MSKSNNIGKKGVLVIHTKRSARSTPLIIYLFKTRYEIAAAASDGAVTGPALVSIGAPL
jgi:hypothetical protein